jgi:hypothetical protein
MISPRGKELGMNGTAVPMPPRWRMWLRHNDMMRRTDWVQAALLVAVFAAAIVLLPIALAAGSETYASRSQVVQEQRQTRHPATATLMQDAPPVTYGTHGEVVTKFADVPARWTAPDGSERTGKVTAKQGTKSGEPVRIWLDEAANPVAEPLKHADAAVAGIVTAMSIWGSVVVGLFVLYRLARFGLNRYRSAAWEREWARVEPDWTRSA